MLGFVLVSGIQSIWVPRDVLWIPSFGIRDGIANNSIANLDQNSLNYQSRQPVNMNRRRPDLGNLIEPLIVKPIDNWELLMYLFSWLFFPSFFKSLKYTLRVPQSRLRFWNCSLPDVNKYNLYGSTPLRECFLTKVYIRLLSYTYYYIQFPTEYNQ